MNRIDKVGRTPLHFAVFHSQSRVVGKLLDRYADVHARDNYGQVCCMAVVCVCVCVSVVCVVCIRVSWSII